jgi:hypothetical protein
MNRGRITGVVYLVLFLMGYALTLISTAFYVALIGLFYLLFRHVAGPSRCSQPSLAWSAAP